MKKVTARRYLILGLLLDGAKHGYELHRSDLLQIWGIPMSQLYSLLKRLEKEGMIEASLKFQETRPGKRIFSLTQKGRLAFLDWVQSPVEKMRDIRTEFIAKLFIIHKLCLGIELPLIERQLKVCRRRKEALSRETGENDVFNSLIKSYRRGIVDTTLRWLRQCQKTFEVRKDA